MKNLILITITFALFSTFALAQKGPLKGSGKTVIRNFDYKDFDKISVEDFDGIVEIEVGKPFSVNIQIDDNLEPMLAVENDNSQDELKVFLKNNKNGRLYLEETNIKIKITMPSAKAIKHRGNTKINITGLTGRTFSFENNGNGDAFLEGKVDILNINKIGNGAVNAKNLFTKTAEVKSYGNGNVLVNSQISLSAFGTGNCSVMQFGKGQINALSGIIGNGEVRKM